MLMDRLLGILCGVGAYLFYTSPEQHKAAILAVLVTLAITALQPE